MKSKLFPDIAVVCIVLLPVIAGSQQRAKSDHSQCRRGCAAGIGKSSFPQPNWMVKYTAGSLNLTSDQWLRIAFVPQTAALSKANLIMNVTADQFVSVEYSGKAKKGFYGPRSGCGYAKSMLPEASKPAPERAVATVESPGFASRLAARPSRKHPVMFVWNEGGSEKSITVQVNACEYQSFIATTRSLLAARWDEIAREFR